MDILKEHRFLGKLNKSILEGNNLFFLYGKGLNDYSLFNLHLGIKEILESLFLYFYNVENVDAFGVKKGNRIVFYNKEFQEVNINEILGIKKEIEGEFSYVNDIDDEEVTQKAEKTTNNIANSNQDIENDFHYIKNNSKNHKIALFFDDFEWQANLYGEADLNLLKQVRELEKYKNILSVIAIKEPKLLEEYGFDVDEELSNMLYVGRPSQKEISKTFRRFIYTQREDIEIIESDFEEIVSSLQSNKRKLRETIVILKRILNSLPKNSTLFKNLFKDALNKPIEEKVTFDDVILNTPTKRELISIMDTFYNNKEDSIKGIILTGPPGTGKTFIAKAIANEYNMNYMAPTLADLKGEHIGQTSGNVKRFFEEARANAPTIIFLDEIDTMFAKRDGSDTDSYQKDMVNQFLVEIDGAKTGKQEIFIIGATNRIEVVDSAIRSRLSREFLIDLPNAENRELIFDAKFKSFKLSRQPWKKEIIQKTEGLSGRDIDSLVKAIRRSVENNEDRITKRVFDAALETLEERFINDFKRDMKHSIEILSKVNITFDDIIGYDNIKTILRQESEYILADEDRKNLMKQYNLEIRRGNLLYGPPGNGKTTFAKALAGSYDFYFIKILSKDFSAYSSVDIIQKLDTIFKNTIKLSNMTNKKGIVLFFDEIDSLINRRMDNTIRGTLLNYLEDTNGIKADNSKIILMSATNFYEELDEASIREGRFDVKLEINNPSTNQAIAILKSFFEKDNTLKLEVDNEYYENLLARKTSFSIVDLKNIKEREKLKAFYNNSFEDNLLVIKN